MDERVFCIQLGQPIPPWDRAHRLPISGCIGPECKDSGTVHRINSSYMDVSEQPHMMRHWLAGAIQTSILFAMICFAFSMALITDYFPLKHDFWLYFNSLMCFSAALGFLYVACKFGRDEIFSLTRRPIRFNRIEKKIFAIRRRRYFASENDGDVTCEIPWNDKVFFCIHKGPKNSEHDSCYHIRYYEVDSVGNVTLGFALGREWQDLEGLNDLLCQWNYWCHYMNEGPADLPKPLLFLSEKEDLFESFLYCMYEAGFGLSANVRMAFFPFFCWMTIHRVLSLWSCRPPIWPAEVEKVNLVSDSDICRQPTGATPIGWAQTSQARQTKAYPSDPRSPTLHWRGENDGRENAKRWSAEIAPGN